MNKDVDSLALRKTELEGKVDLLRREFEFRRCVYLEELAQLDGHVCDTNILLQMDNNRGLDVDCIIRNVEAWYQSIAQRSKEEVNALYENRFQELQEQRGKYSDNLKINQHEIADLTRLVNKLQSENDAIKKQVDILQSAICDVEHRGDGALKDARDKHIELQTALQKAKDDLAGLLRDYHELLNTKLALDIEIATYKTLLEGEEYRIVRGNPVAIDVFKPPYTEGSAGFTSSGAHGPTGGGYGGGHSEGHRGGYSAGGHGSYKRSSRSVGNHPRTVDSHVDAGHASADAELYSGTQYSSQNVSQSACKPSSPVGVDSPTTGGRAGIGVDCGPGAGFSSGSAQASASKGHATGSIGGGCPDGGYLSGGYGPPGVIPFGAGFGHRIAGGLGVVGCQPGVGGPSIGGFGFGGEPCVGVGAPVGVCIPRAIGAPIGVCCPGAIGAPVGVCYPGPVGAHVGVCYPGAVGPFRNTAI
uniref:keratin, type II cytoskeletal 2 epidermal-like isoform X1 n=1 Tax=Podarcis muralis TaxID=64176 RepID=UPI00109F45D3|nr:keratin, type II cytoskeletal 2 epidermal-like isoform X1 [Podarcis muralis]